MGSLFTFGYSGLEIHEFTELLQQHGVDVVCDVRSSPYSFYKPDFSRRPLKAALNQVGLKYTFLGEYLGARPKDRSCYENGQATYERIANQEFFAQGLNRVRSGMATLNLALVCSEKDPIDCHRAILVCQHLRDIGSQIFHLHTDGRLEDHQSFEERLVETEKTAPPPLLRQPAEWPHAVAAAYARRGLAIAFREREEPIIESLNA